MTPLRVGILGAGRIAQGFDAPGDAHVATLAHAVVRSPDLELGGFYDADPARAAAAERKWKAPESPRDRAAWLKEGWDVICIATPDAQHGADVADVIAARPQAIWVEKPLATGPGRGAALLAEAERRKVPVLVDYPRRWHSAVASLRAAAPALGAPFAATFTYSAGAAHNGVHLFDLFHQAWPGPWTVEGRGRGGAVAQLRFESSSGAVDAALVEVPGDHYYAFELQTYCARGKVEVTGSPEELRVWTLSRHAVYRDFTVLGASQRFAMEAEPLLARAFAHLVSIARDDATAQAHAHGEREAQRFLASVLDALKE